MKRLIARFLSAILVISICVVIMPIKVNAAGFNVATWSDFVDALSLLKGYGTTINGGTITLTANITSASGDKIDIKSLEQPLYINTGSYSFNIQNRTVELGENVVITGTNSPPIRVGSSGSVVVSGAKIAKTSKASWPAVIQVENNGVLALNSGQISGKMRGVVVFDSGIFTARGGLISTTDNNSIGLLIQNTGQATISGTAMIAASGSNCIGVQCYGRVTINETSFVQAGGSKAVAIWVSESGTLTFNAGRAEALGNLSTGIVSSGNSKLYNVNITSESVGMSVTGGQTYFMSGFGSIIAGTKYGLVCKGMFNQFGGSISGYESGIYLGNGGNAVIYNGKITSYNLGSDGIHVESYPVDPSMIIYSAVEWNKRIRKSGLQRKIHQIDSFEVIGPTSLFLTTGRDNNATFTVKGVEKNGSLITMQDLLGPSGSFSMSGGNSVLYTVSGNAVTFKPTVTGSGILSIQDSITYNKMSRVSVTVGTQMLLPVAVPVANPAGGTFDTQQSIVLSCSTAGAKIYYTINGAEPTTSSTIYATPISLAATTTIKAIAVKSGMTNSPVITKTYTVSTESVVLSMSNFTKMRTYTRGMFTDVDEKLWYGFDRNKAIADAYEYGLMVGDSASTFNPTGNVSIAEAITMAARVRSIYTTGAGDFTPSSPWYQTYADYAIANGIIKSYDFSNYGRAATRAEIAYVFSNALPISEFAEQNTVNSLPDVTSTTQYYSSILLLYKSGVLSGVDAAGTFHAGKNISRAEAAAIISRVAVSSKRGTRKVF